MGFTVAARGRVGLYAPLPDPELAPLGKVRRGQDGEVTGAATRDEKWIFIRQDDDTWSAGHLPSETHLKDGLGDLEACRRYAGSGQADADLEQIQAGRPAGT